MAAVDFIIPQIIMTAEDAKAARFDKKQAKNKDLQRTRLCVYNLEGNCGYGSNCSFAHSATEIKDVPNLRKTQLCSKFAEGKCNNKNCSYAHGAAELRDPPNHKKKICKWHQKGACRNGASCGFAHEIAELRAAPPPGFAPVVAKEAPLKVKKLPKVGLPPGLSQMGSEFDCDASTDVSSSQSQAECPSEDSSPMHVSVMPEEHIFRMVAGRGSAPLQHQVTLMSSAIGGLQAKLAQLEDMMLQNQVIQMKQQIEMLTSQCSALESGLATAQPQPAPVGPTSLRSRLNREAVPFKPVGSIDGKSDDSTSVGSA